MTLAYVQRELAKLHRMNHSLFEDEAELEFLKVTCRTPNSIYLFSQRQQILFYLPLSIVSFLSDTEDLRRGEQI